MNKEKILNEFKEKLDNEFNQYKTETLKCTKEEIFNRSSEIAIKEEIIRFLKEFASILPANEIEALSKTNDMLSVYYQDWRNWDSPLSGDLINCVCDTVGEILHRELGNTENYEKL